MWSNKMGDFHPRKPLKLLSFRVFEDVSQLGTLHVIELQKERRERGREQGRPRGEGKRKPVNVFA